MKIIVKHLIPNVGIFLIVGLLFLAQSVGALPSAAPAEPLAASQPLISYQGTLTDKSGNPVNATATMEFALYDAESGGNLLWGPETQAVQVSEGLFHVLLGSVAPIDPTDFTGDLYLNVKVNGEPLVPREQLTSVANAVQTSLIDGDLDMRDHRIENLGIGPVNFSIGDETGIGNAHFTLYEGDRFNFRWIDDQGNVDDVFLIKQSGIVAHAPVDMRGENIVDANKVGVGTSNPTWGRVQIDAPTVPLAFRETDQSGEGSLWRVPLDGGNLRFDISDNGTDFDTYKTPITFYANGSIGCGALTEANLQTPGERTAERIDRFEEGDVLCWGIDRLEKCILANDRLVQAVADTNGRPIVIGAERVKVVGPVKRGDILVASDVPGYAMVNNNPISGSVIAQALEDFEGEQGIIKAMIRKW